MIKQTHSASRQFNELLDKYIEKEWDQAIRNLVAAYRNAAAQIEADPTCGKSHPRPYPQLSRYGFRWIESHIYWVGYSTAKGYPVITNFFNNTHDIPGRIADEDEEIEIDV